MNRARTLLLLTVPACVATGWYTVRAMKEMQTANSASVVATVPAAPEQRVALPAPGTYWVVGIGGTEVLKAARQWNPTLVNLSTGDSGTVDTGDPERTARRKDRGGLDLLFTMRVPDSGTYVLSLRDMPGGIDSPDSLYLRITRFSRTGAGVAMRSMASGILFSILLLASAMIWFRQR